LLSSCSAVPVAKREPCNIDENKLNDLYFPDQPPYQIVNGDLILIMQTLRADIKIDNKKKALIREEIALCNNI